MGRLLGLIPQDEYIGIRQGTHKWYKEVFQKSLTQGELTKIAQWKDSVEVNKAANFYRGPAGPTNHDEYKAYKADYRQREAYARRVLQQMAYDKYYTGKLAKAGGVTTALGYNFYDLRAPVFLLYPVNVPFRNMLPRVGRVNDGYGTAAHWQATRNYGVQYAGVSEGLRNAIATPDDNNYIASYKELGIERGVSFTAQFAGEGFADNLADEHLRGLHELWLQEEGIILNGNSGTGSGNNGFQLGQAPTPAGTAVANHTIGAAGNLGTPGNSDLPYNSILTNTQYVSVAVVLLTAMGNPANTQYGYGVFPSIAAGLTPSYVRTNADNSTNTVNGGMSQISQISAPVEATTGLLTISFTLPANSLPLKGVYGYAWFVDVESSNTGSLGNAVLAGITYQPSCFVSGTPTGLQTGTAQGLNADHSYSPLDFDGLLTYGASTAGAYYVDLYGGSLTSQKNGRVTQVEQLLETVFINYQAGIDEIWGSPDAVTQLDAAVRYSGTTATGYQFFVTRDQQNNILGGFVISQYQSRYAVNSETGANAIPIKIHPMIPPGTLYFLVKNNPYPHSRVPYVAGMLVQRDYYSIEWPLVTRQWTFGTYVHEVLAHTMPWIPGIITGIGTFVGS